MSVKKKDVVDFCVTASIDAFYTGGQCRASDDGRWLLCPSGSQVCLLDTDTGLVRHRLCTASTCTVTSLAVQQVEGREAELHVAVALSSLCVEHYLVVSTNDSTEPDVQLQRTWKTQHKGYVTQMTFAHDATVLITGSSDSTVKVWHLQLQYGTHHIKSSAPVTTLTLYHRSQLLAIGADDGAVHIVDLMADASQRHKCTLSAHTSTVVAVVVQTIVSAEEGRADVVRLVVASRDQTMSIWLAANTDAPDTFTKSRTLPLFESVECFVPVITAPDLAGLEDQKQQADDLFLSAGEQGALKLWNVRTGRKLYELSLKAGSSSTAESKSDANTDTNALLQVLVARQGASYFVVSAEHNIHRLDAFTMRLRSQLVGHNDQIHDAAVVGSDGRLLAVASNSSQLRVYDTTNLDCALVNLHDDLILAVQASPAAPDHLCTASKDNTIAVCTVRHDGQRIQVACVSRGSGHTSGVGCVAWSRAAKPEAAFIVSAADDSTLKIWPFNAAQPPATLTATSTLVAHDKDITCVDVSPNDQLVATGSLDKTVRLWRVTPIAAGYSLSPAATIEGAHKRGVWDLAFSPTDQVLVTGSGDCCIRIFALADQSCVKTLQSHSCAVLKVSCLQNGTQLLSADSGGLVKLWDIASSECTRTWEAHDAKVWALIHDWPHKRMITGGSDSKVLLWSDISDELAVEQHAQHVKQAEQQQQLDNLMAQKNYAEALRVALQLNRPAACLTATETLLAQPDTRECLLAVVRGLDDDRLHVFIGCIAQWNNSARNAQTAQSALNSVLRARTPDQLLGMRHAEQYLAKLLPCTQKHYDRLARLQQQALFLNYVASRNALADA